MRRQRPQNVDAEFGGGCHQFAHVRRTGRSPGRLTQFEHKVLKSGGSAKDQHMSWCYTYDPEAMRNVARTEYEITCPREKPCAIDEEGDLTRDDVERFILLAMDMVGSFKARGHQWMVDEGEGPVRLSPFRSVKGL